MSIFLRLLTKEVAINEKVAYKLGDFVEVHFLDDKYNKVTLPLEVEEIVLSVRLSDTDRILIYTPIRDKTIKISISDCKDWADAISKYFVMFSEDFVKNHEYVYTHDIFYIYQLTLR